MVRRRGKELHNTFGRYRFIFVYMIFDADRQFDPAAESPSLNIRQSFRRIYTDMRNSLVHIINPGSVEGPPKHRK